MRYVYKSIENMNKYVQRQMNLANYTPQLTPLSTQSKLSQTLLFALFLFFFVMVYDPLPNIRAAQFMFFEPFRVFVI
jgi:hypothetical protein